MHELIAHMESGDPLMIFAGYPEPMQRLFACFPGLSSRIPMHLLFPNYTIMELAKMLKEKLERQQYMIRKDVNCETLLETHTTEAKREREPQWKVSQSHCK